MSKALYTSPDRIYLNSRGEPCGPKDPDKQTLLVAAGGSLPMEDAQRYGLLNAPSLAPPVTVMIDLPANATPTNRLPTVKEVDELIEASSPADQSPTVTVMESDESFAASSTGKPKPTAKPSSKPAPKKK